MGGFTNSAGYRHTLLMRYTAQLDCYDDSLGCVLCVLLAQAFLALSHCLELMLAPDKTKIPLL